MKKSFSIFLLSFLLISLAGSVFAAGLVPCGNPDQKPCTICDFFVLISNVINFVLFTIVPPLAILLLAVGGFMYMVSYVAPGQGPNLISRAKSVIVSTLIGLVIIYGAFVIVGTFLSLIGLASWTTDIYGNWMQGKFFEIKCGSSSTSTPAGGGNTITPNSSAPATSVTPSTATPSSGDGTNQTLWDTMSQQRKDNMTQSVAKSIWKDMPYSGWAVASDGNLILKMPGYVYYKFSKDELNTLWNTTVQEAEMEVKQSAQSLPPGSLLDVKTDLVKTTLLMTTWIEGNMQKEAISSDEAQKQIATDNVDPFSYFSPGQ